MEKTDKALLIVDMLKDFIEEGGAVEVPAGRWIIENIAGEIRYAREKNRPIIYICDRHAPDDPDFDLVSPHAIRGTRGAEVVDDLAPQPGDHLVEKVGFSGFFRTNLEALLDELEIDEVLICGVLTNVGIFCTAVDALQRGIRTIIPETCVAALNEQDHKYALRQLGEAFRLMPRE